jgi:hypothetical protein
MSRIISYYIYQLLENLDIVLGRFKEKKTIFATLPLNIG